METCCAADAVEARDPRRCVECGAAGKSVGLITLKAVLRPAALARLSTRDHYFCGSASCPVVYFGEGGILRREDVSVPVFQKAQQGSRTVCYCFEITEDQIRREVEAAGVSASAERIKTLVRDDCCACEVRNPQGACCLGNVAAVVRSVQRLCVG
jgi:hypothetical protein